MTSQITCRICISGNAAVDRIFAEALTRLEAARLDPNIKFPIAHVFFGHPNFELLPSPQILRLIETSTYEFTFECTSEPDEFLQYLIGKISQIDPCCYVENFAYEDEYRKTYQLAWLAKSGPKVETRSFWLEMPDEDDFADSDDFEEARIKEHEQTDHLIDEAREEIFSLAYSDWES